MSSSAYRPKARLALVAVAAALGLAVWGLAFRGHPAADGATPTQALAELLVHDGLQLANGGAILPRNLADQGRGWAPAFVVAKEAGQEDTPEDFYYVELRADADGNPIQARRLTNLTRTPQGRERLLARTRSKALIEVSVFDERQALLVVDFKGDERDTSALKSTAERLRYKITNFQETGRAEGFGMYLYALESAPTAIQAQPQGDSFALSLSYAPEKKGEPARTVQAVLHTDQPLDAQLAERLKLQPRYLASKATVPWVVDTIRDLSFVGPTKVAKLEQFVFAWKDRAKQAAYGAGLVSADDGLADELGNPGGALPGAPSDPGGAQAPADPSVALGAGSASSKDWPPPKVASAIAEPSPGEGEWSPAQFPWLRALPGAPPAFYKTAVRTDPKRPYDAIILIAMDMRQLDLGMQAGTTSPESSFGNRGTGLIPREPARVDRLVGAFNGGFKTAHGAFGMVVERKTILPPLPYAATLTVRDGGQVQVGTWYNSMLPPDDVHSLRQNLPPLMADGKFNPTGKRKWGGTASDLDDVHTTRSGLGLRAPNTLVYAWCKSCSADALGQALLNAGCEYGMHLDMNPTHTGWSWYRTDMADLGPKDEFARFDVAKGSPNMDFDEARYIERDVKDFFYLTLRRELADAMPKAPEGFNPWSAQHAPAGPDGFLTLAASAQGPGSDLMVAFDLGMVAGRARAGDKEGGDPSPKIELSSPAALLDLGAGQAGLIEGGTTRAPLDPSQPALVAEEGGALRWLSPQQLAGFKPEGARLLLGGQHLLRAGEPVAAEPPASSSWLHALGVDGQGRLLYAALQGRDPAALAARLKGAGAREAMLLPPSPVRDDASRLRYLRVQGGRLEEVDPLTGAAQPFDEGRRASTHLYLERQAAPRAARLLLQDVELPEEEAQRQKRLQAQIQSLREELRRIENAKYKAFIEKKNAPKTP